MSYMKDKETNFTYDVIKNNKILWNKFNKEMKNPYTESYQTLIKEIGEDTNK